MWIYIYIMKEEHMHKKGRREKKPRYSDRLKAIYLLVFIVPFATLFTVVVLSNNVEMTGFSKTLPLGVEMLYRTKGIQNITIRQDEMLEEVISGGNYSIFLYTTGETINLQTYRYVHVIDKMVNQTLEIDYTIPDVLGRRTLLQKYITGGWLVEPDEVHYIPHTWRIISEEEIET